MITKNQFKKALQLVQDFDKEDDLFAKSLQAYAGESDFTDFHSNRANRLLDLLLDIMGDNSRDSLIEWWLFDCPNAGKCKEDDNCTIWDKNDSKKWVIRTVDDLYDYLVKDLPKSEEYGVGYALKTINDIREANAKTKNPGYESRETILKYTKDKIATDYLSNAATNELFDLLFKHLKDKNA